MGVFRYGRATQATIHYENHSCLRNIDKRYSNDDGIKGAFMTAQFKDIETHALSLPMGERSALVARLLDSLDDMLVDESPEALAAVWQDEVAHRVSEFEAGKTHSVTHEQVVAAIRTMVDSHAKR